MLKFKNHRSLKYHNHRLHRTDPVQCFECQLLFANNYLLRNHKIQQHPKHTYECPDCGKCFKRRENLKSHLLVHSDYRPFMCDLCAAKYKSYASLKEHILRLHTGHTRDKKPFICSLCSYAFKRCLQLKIHLETMHFDQGYHEWKNLTQIICIKCNSKFLSLEHLERHNFKLHRKLCEICHLIFESKDILDDHILMNHSMEQFSSTGQQKCEVISF